MKTFLALLAGATLLAGCSFHQGPSVSLVNVHFQDATVLETAATFTLRLSNENPEPVTYNGGVHKIYLNGLYVGKGLCADSVTVPRLGTVTNNVTVHLSNLLLATRIKPIIDSQSFDYRITSRFYGDSTFGGASSENTGRLDLKEFTPATQP